MQMKAYRYRLYPTKSQVSQMEQTLEICRWVYNETLAMRKNAWEQEQKHISYYESKRQIPLWKKEHPELNRVYSQVLQDVSMRVDLAFKGLLPASKGRRRPWISSVQGGRGDTTVSHTLSTDSNLMEIASIFRRSET